MNDCPTRATGLRDDDGEMINERDCLRLETTGNVEYHGHWTMYQVKMKGDIPYLSYVRSETGEVLPEGYLRQLLTDCYDQKLLLFGDLDQLRPTVSLKRCAGEDSDA